VSAIKSVGERGREYHTIAKRTNWEFVEAAMLNQQLNLLARLHYATAKFVGNVLGNIEFVQLMNVFVVDNGCNASFRHEICCIN